MTRILVDNYLSTTAMKKMITMLSLLLLSISVTAAVPKPLTVEGKFVKTTVVSYDLYVMNPDSSYALIESKTVHKYFSVQVLTGATYLMRFTTAKGDSVIVKYLLINPVKKDNFLVDVDFSNEDSAELYWHAGANCYQIRPYDPGSIKLTSNVARR
jgi:hypothetical protein